MNGKLYAPTAMKHQQTIMNNIKMMIFMVGYVLCVVGGMLLGCLLVLVAQLLTLIQHAIRAIRFKLSQRSLLVYNKVGYGQK